MTRTAHLLVDYQNVHISAHESFESLATPVKQSQIHVVKFADQVAARLSEEQPTDVVKVDMFRGLPDARRESLMNGVVQLQHRAWQSSGVQIHTRPLQYLPGWPNPPAQEKGIDVMLAVKMLVCASVAEPDLIVVATRDTDQIPAIELAARMAPGRVRIVTWYGRSQLSVAGVPTLVMDSSAYQQSRDTRDYGAEVRGNRRR